MSDPNVNTLPQTVSKGAGRAIIKVLRNGSGPLDPPQSFTVPELLDIDWSDKHEKKSLMGGGSRPIGMMSGKKEVTVSITVAAFYGDMINKICYGGELENRKQVDHFDNIGHVVDATASVRHKIRNSISIHFGRLDSLTSLSIAGTAASAAGGTDPAAGEYVLSERKLTFNSADKGKNFVLIYVSNGTTITTAGKIPATLIFDVRLFTSSSALKLNGIARTKQAYTALDKPDTTHFMCASNGVVVLNPGAALNSGKVLELTHATSGVSCVSTVSTLPAYGYYFYIDAPAYSGVGEVTEVILRVDSNTSTGLALEDQFQIITSGSVDTGKVKDDGSGYLVFAAADVNDEVKIVYLSDYVAIPVDLPSDSDFIEDLGVHNGIKPYVRVPMQFPLSIEAGQYAIDEKGAVIYMDFTEQGNTIYHNFTYETDGGTLLHVTQSEVGKDPVMQLNISTGDGEDYQGVKFYHAVSEGMGVKTKSDDFGDGLKFTFNCAVDRKTKRSFSISHGS